MSIGNGAVVGSGAVGADDVDPYTVVTGVLVKPIRRRLPESIAASIEATKWWYWDHETIGRRIGAFRPLDTMEFASEDGHRREQTEL